MKKKVLILGRRGMLGSMVTQVLSHDSHIHVCATSTEAADEDHFDLLDGIAGLDRLARKKGPFDAVINCIGMTADRIDAASNDSVTRALRINALFPHELASWAERHGTWGIHMSTDGVFSGRADSYDEDAPHDCPDVYGKTKSLGEVSTARFLSVRCSIVGPSPFQHRGLMEWFLSQPEGANVKGFTNHYWNGVTTRQLADLLAVIIAEDRFDFLREKSSIFHFAPNPVISKYELLKMLAEVSRRRISVTPVVSETGDIRRVLTTRYECLKNLYAKTRPFKEELALLAAPAAV